MTVALVWVPRASLPDAPDSLTLSLDDYASLINGALAECDRAASETVHWMLEAGRLLEEVKAELPHGEYEAWVIAHCDVTPRMVRLYRQAWRQGRHLKPETISGLRTLRDLLDHCRRQAAPYTRTLEFESSDQRDAYDDALRRHPGAASNPVPFIIWALTAQPVMRARDSKYHPQN